MSIMPPGSESNNAAPPIVSLRTIADLMSKSPDTYTVNVGFLVEYIAQHHELPITCSECTDDDLRRESTPCLMYESALSVAFAWLLKVNEERG